MPLRPARTAVSRPPGRGGALVSPCTHVCLCLCWAVCLTPLAAAPLSSLPSFSYKAPLSPGSFAVRERWPSHTNRAHGACGIRLGHRRCCWSSQAVRRTVSEAIKADFLKEGT